MDVAKRMGINPSAVTRIEKNVTKASWHTLKRYAAACGVELSLTAK
ncbi:helix-turn-helix domain-containing protein [Photorhabdus luminescens]